MAENSSIVFLPILGVFGLRVKSCDNLCVALFSQMACIMRENIERPFFYLLERMCTDHFNRQNMPQ